MEATAPIPDANHYLVGEDKQGPFDLIELAAQLRTSAINAQTLIYRAGQTEGTPLEALPEYAEIRDMPVEKIARHLEEKERTASPNRPKLSSSFQLAIAAGVILLILAIAIVTQPQQPPPNAAPVITAPPSDPWRPTGGDGFTVDCLAPLRLVVSKPSSKIQLHSYRANAVGIGFGVDTEYVPVNASEEDIKAAINASRDLMLAGLDGQFISETPFIVNGHSYRKTVFFSQNYLGKKMAGGICIIGTPDRVAGAWAVARSTKYGSEEIQRYVNSFQLR